MFQMPLPRQDSSGAILLDLFGSIRTINITGILEGTEAEQRTFITTIEGYAAGAQTGKAFVSSLVTSPASYNVFIQNFRWIKNAGTINKLDYTLNLIQGASIS